MWNTFGYMKCDYSHGEQSIVSETSFSIPGHCHHESSSDHGDENCSDCGHQCSAHTLIKKDYTQSMRLPVLIGEVQLLWTLRYKDPLISSSKRPPIQS